MVAGEVRLLAEKTAEATRKSLRKLRPSSRKSARPNRPISQQSQISSAFGAVIDKTAEAMAGMFSEAQLMQREIDQSHLLSNVELANLQELHALRSRCMTACSIPSPVRP